MRKDKNSLETNIRITIPDHVRRKVKRKVPAGLVTKERGRGGKKTGERVL